jgi:two-component system CheB/CheR fusion protein
MAKTFKKIPKKQCENLFPVVGIGASAGGLDAFKKLIQSIPEKSGMAYILVQHLHPGYESTLPEILQRETKIPVVEISNKVQVEPDFIYVIPSNKLLIATDGILKLSPRPTAKINNLPIDLFFSSLAEVHQSQSIGVILSGTGSDGTIGLEEIKTHGGFTFAQDPETASYGTMPKSAIDAGIIDYVLAPQKIPGKLKELQKSFEFADQYQKKSGDDTSNEGVFKLILALLKMRVDVDFNFYKQSTIRRRIERRIVMHKLKNIREYLRYLKNNATELDLLFQDLLIQVTSFFRDPDAFDVLSKKILAETVKTNITDNTLRIWVPACATGQEAYSIAMCLSEYLNKQGSAIKVKIFATDLSEKAITKARAGIYSEAETEGVSESRLQQFFTKTNGNYSLKKTVRNMCVFAVHNFLKDPPFAKMHLISCRNALIYFEPFLQKKALTIFHYSLIPKGFLFLGKSETVGDGSDIFSTFDKKNKFYSQKPVHGGFINVVSQRNENAFNTKNYFLSAKEEKTDDFQKNADEILLSKFTPVGVVVNDQYDIVQFRGSTGGYLEPSPGKASLNVMKMAREGLGFEIRNALENAKSTGEPFIRQGIPINKGKKLVTLEVIPLLNTIDLYYLILFSDASSGSATNEEVNENNSKAKVAKQPARKKRDPRDIRLEQLEKELAQVRRDMLRITEDQEAVNEELQSSNEELLSGSEELQTLNEEMETSKEELQSTNEELITINQELNDRNDELDKLRKFSESVISILHEPLLVLDKDFVIKMANAAFYKTFKITEEETLGKVIFELQDSKWDITGLRKELRNTRKEKGPMKEIEKEHTFPTIGTRDICFNIQMLYKEGAEPLILLALGDITETKKQHILRESEKKFRELVEGLPVAVYLCDAEGYITQYNDSVVELWGCKPEIGKDKWGIWKGLTKEGKRMPLKEYPVAIALKEGRITNPEIIVERPDGQRRNVIPYPKLIYNEDNKITGCINTMIDITDQVNIKKLVQQHADRMKSFFMQTPAILCILKGPEYVFELANPLYRKLIGDIDPIGKKLLDVLPELKEQGFMEGLDKVYMTGQSYIRKEVPFIFEKIKGKPIKSYFDFSNQVYKNALGETEGILVFAYDVTEKVLARTQLEQNAELTQKLFMNSPAFMCTLRGPKHIYDLVNPACQKMFGSKQIVGKPIAEVLSDQGGESICKAVDKVYQTGEMFVATEARLWVAYDEGLLPEERYFNFSCQPIYDENKKITGIQVIGYEVTHEVLAKKKSEAQLRLILESIPQITISLTARGKITFFNQYALDYFGLTMEEAISGGGWIKIIHPDELKAVISKAEHCLISGEDFYKESRLRRNSDGKYVWHLMRATPIKDGKGNAIISWVGVATDIQEQKIKEQKKDEFISIASHEMKTPLTSANGYLQLLERMLDGNNTQAAFLANKALKSVTRLNNLITELLQVNKIQYGKLNYNITTFDFNKMVDETIEDQRNASPDYTIIKKGKIASEITGDRERLQQVVINLVSNGIKYSPGQKEILVTIKEKTGDLIFSVKDNGIGISKENFENVFKRFFRVPDQAMQFQGMGIGLYISSEIIKRHGGRMWVESKREKGSIFYFSIPLGRKAGEE